MIKDVKYVDGMIESLKQFQPLVDKPDNLVYDMMQRRDISGYKIGKLVRALHEHRETVKDGLDEDILAPEKPLTILYDATENRVSLSVANRQKQDDGTYPTHARVTLSRAGDGKWHVDSFFTSLDPSEADSQLRDDFVDIGEGIRDSYKHNDQKFVADFLKELSNGGNIWDGIFRADNNDKISGLYDKMALDPDSRKTIMPIKDGRVPGSFDYASGARVSKVPPKVEARPKI